MIINLFKKINIFLYFNYGIKAISLSSENINKRTLRVIASQKSCIENLDNACEAIFHSWKIASTEKHISLITILCLAMTICSFLMSILLFPAYGEEVKKAEIDNRETVGLKQIVELIESKNLDLHVARMDITQAKGNCRRITSRLLPSIRGAYSGEDFNGGEIFIGPTPVSSDRITHKPTLSVDYQIATGGKPFFDMGIYKNQFLRSQVAYTRIHQQALLDALTQYFNWLKDFSNVESAEQSIKQTESQLKINEAKFKTGFGTKLDVLQTKTLLSERKSQALKADNDESMSELTLSTTLNIPYTQRIKPEESRILPLNFFKEDPTLPELYDIAQKNRPDIQENIYLIREAKAALKSAYSDIFPVLNVSSYIRGVGPDFNSLQRSTDRLLGLNMDLLKYMGVDILGNIQTARAKLKQAILSKEKALNDTYKSISKAYYDYRYYQEQVKVNEEKIDTANEAYRIATARLKMGVGLNLDVVQAQTDLANATLEYHTSVMSLNIAQIRLLFEAGQLIPEKIFAAVPQEAKKP